MQNKKNLGPLAFGLDIGIASVGWAVLGENRIIDLGVRCFDKAETADKGESLNLARRMARLLRRRLRRRAWRLTKLARLLKREALIHDVSVLKQAPSAGFKTPDLWRLRVAALERKLEPEEWARVIYHICKHRGFHWLSKAEEKAAESDKEGGAVKKGLAGTKRLMQEKQYRTAAEMVISEFPDAQRNKRGDYSKALSRLLLDDELRILFDRQRSLGNPHTSETFEQALRDRQTGLLWAQHPALSGENLLEMLGECTFEKPEYRAPKASFTVERHVWLTRLNNLRLIVDGERRALNEAERHRVLNLPYEQSSDFSYKQLRKALEKAGLTADFRFAGLVYPNANQEQHKTKDPEEEKLVKMPAWQTLRKSMKEAGLEEDWRQVTVAALDGKPQLYDEIARVLSVYKEDEEVERELNKLDLPNKDDLIQALLTVRFDKFSNLSFKALYRILPYMEKGQRYDEACIEAGYHHSQPQQSIDHNYKDIYLPPLYEQHRGKEKHNKNKMIFSKKIEREIQGGIPRNPVVLRALNQARKVVNALIKIYGSPHEVHIEMARDLSRPLDERRKIEGEQKAFRDVNEQERERFVKDFGRQPSGREMEKWLLYREQDGQSPYSQKPLAPFGDVAEIFSDNTTQIDHVLPYARSYDNSRNNKVLVLTKENQEKGNRTPFEYLNGSNENIMWHNFVGWVTSNKKYRSAKRNRLLKKDFGEDEEQSFRERNLNDTRYICRFFKNYVEKYLKLADCDKVKRCVVVNGSLTSLLRARWGLGAKKRDTNDRHHALDAAIVAASGHLTVQRLATFVNEQNWTQRKNETTGHMEYVNTKTGEVLPVSDFVKLDEVLRLFPHPWSHFRQELLTRLNEDNLAVLRKELKQLGNYSLEELEKLRILFISRSPKRRNGGALHEATIRSPKRLNQGISYVKVPLQQLTLAKLKGIVGATYSRNAPLIALLRERLEQYGNDGKKAFADPVHKPSKTGKGSLVKSVKVASTQNNGVMLDNGIAELGDMHHVNVFKNGDRYLIEPIYQIFTNRLMKPLQIPSEAEFLFTLNKNDYIKLCLGGVSYEGYFVMYESDGRLTLRAHDQPKPDKDYFRKSVTSAQYIQKFHVDILGNLYPALPEKRRDLA
ncbi:type II CRISPR RNA-guided endonuclease Cas9 [Methylobacillus sp.]|uniref:type II CRISPR RNA-guided endonuclease Cas9 n=1 Tax=Methylobacillus sp. TaxID=56818 RepID=UPI0012D28AA4|nr:type II CRISPR RNA-guided endonuclease Cas9 [Methylobacillus sp.]MPS49505.1 type II CRISPR RNA-guided endonuclease Cas9 [Methylobacillus sp.]